MLITTDKDCELSDDSISNMSKLSQSTTESQTITWSSSVEDNERTVEKYIEKMQKHERKYNITINEAQLWLHINGVQGAEEWNTMNKIQQNIQYSNWKKMIKGITTKRSGIDEFHCSNAEEAIRNIDENEIMRTHERTKQNQRASHP